MNKPARPEYWIIELDYNADPEVTESHVRAAIQDELSCSSADIDDDIVYVDSINEALAVRMRFDSNIIGIYPQFA